MPDDERLLVLASTARRAALPPSHDTFTRKSSSHSASQPEASPRLHDLQASGSSARPAIAPIACLSGRARGFRALSEAWNVPTVTNAVSAPRIISPTPTSASRVSHRPSAPVTSADPKPLTSTCGRGWELPSAPELRGGEGWRRSSASGSRVHVHVRPFWRCSPRYMYSTKCNVCSALHAQPAGAAGNASKRNARPGGGRFCRACAGSSEGGSFRVGCMALSRVLALLRKFW